MEIHKAINVLGAIPVTQQILGLGFVGYGIGKAIANIAARIFHGIQKAIESRKPEANQEKIVDLKTKIRNDKRELRQGVQMILFGLVTMVPIFATVMHVRYLNAQKQ